MGLIIIIKTYICLGRLLNEYVERRLLSEWKREASTFHKQRQIILLIVFDETLSNESEGKEQTLRLGISNNRNINHIHTDKSNIFNIL